MQAGEHMIMPDTDYLNIKHRHLVFIAIISCI